MTYEVVFCIFLAGDRSLYTGLELIANLLPQICEFGEL